VVLDVDTFAAAVARDGAEARRLGIAGTPAILLGAAPDLRLVAGALPWTSSAPCWRLNRTH
jgi:protein-disulfide isomerase